MRKPSARITSGGLYVEREREVTQLWLAALGSCDKATLLLQLYGPEAVFAAAKRLLGEPNACYVRAELPGDSRVREYARRFTRCIRDHMKRFDLEFDPATVTSELWGTTTCFLRRHSTSATSTASWTGTSTAGKCGGWR